MDNSRSASSRGPSLDGAARVPVSDLPVGPLAGCGAVARRVAASAAGHGRLRRFGRHAVAVRAAERAAQLFERGDVRAPPHDVGPGVFCLVEGVIERHVLHDAARNVRRRRGPRGHVEGGHALHELGRGGVVAFDLGREAPLPADAQHALGVRFVLVDAIVAGPPSRRHATPDDGALVRRGGARRLSARELLLPLFARSKAPLDVVRRLREGVQHLRTVCGTMVPSQAVPGPGEYR
mmetsp:Transcript_20618/g.70786  ORF Transcript_20618/g.70786 Transcript_20618/m.70786 type:complete len:236 (-) Transcript_20618:4-711(-)